MQVPELQIGAIVADVPIVQGGMGVRVSLSSLAAAVANEGGIGTISSIGLGDIKDSEHDYEKQSRDALVQVIREAKSMTDGHLAVNFMGVLSNVDDLIKAAVKEGIKIIVYGAGMPVKLPLIVPNPDVGLVPIVSSARVASLILKTWDKRYERIPDALILEGPLAGGHLGFSEEQLEHPEDFALEILIPQLLEAIAAGGIHDGADIARMLSLGASGVQMATRFVCTHECDASDEFKQAYLDATEDDIAIIKSPVGLPGRAINNPFLQKLDKVGKQRIKCPYHCLTACEVDTARYCIALALLNSSFGDTDHGLIFSGKNSYRIDKIVSVNELMDELLAGLRAV